MLIFIRLIFVAAIDYENIFTIKIFRFTGSHFEGFQGNKLLPTWRGSSVCSACLSAARSQRAGTARPVSDSFVPASSFTFFMAAVMSSSVCLMESLYGPVPCHLVYQRHRHAIIFNAIFIYWRLTYVLRICISPSSRATERENRQYTWVTLSI